MYQKALTMHCIILGARYSCPPRISLGESDLQKSLGGSNAVVVQSPRSRVTWKFSFRCCRYMKLPQDMCIPGGSLSTRWWCCSSSIRLQGFSFPNDSGKKKKNKGGGKSVSYKHLIWPPVAFVFTESPKQKKKRGGYKHHNDERCCCLRGASSRVTSLFALGHMNEIQLRVCALLMSPMPTVSKECHRNRRIIGRGGSFDTNRADLKHILDLIH